MKREIEAEISELVGKTIKGIENHQDEKLVFHTECGRLFMFSHNQDCCESVSIEDICGDMDDLIGSPLLVAEESTSSTNPPDASPETLEYQESFTWTFYRFATAKGWVVIRWYGESNGWYSESVDFCEVLQ